MKEDFLKRETKKSWYRRWWAITIFVIAGFVIINYLFLNSSFLEEQGYKVLDFNCMEDYGNSPRVEMKSFGNRNEQVNKGLIYLHNECPEGNKYFVVIIEETKECSYLIDGEILRTYFIALDSEFWNKEYEINEIEIMDSGEYSLWENFVKKEQIKAEMYSSSKIGDPLNISYVDIENYENMNETGITASILHSIVNYNINKFENCE